MIRFSAALVVAGLGLLLAGAIISELPLIYAAIAVSVCAALVLAVGVIAGRNELFGRGAAAAGDERAADRGATPGPGAVAIPEEAVSTGSLPLAGGGPAAAFAGPAQAGAAAPGEVAASAPGSQTAVPGASLAVAGSSGPSYSGLGWPPGKSPSDELWARVDAELAAAGASVRVPKLTRDSAPDEVWGRVEQELTSSARWNPRLVIPVAEELALAEGPPAAGPPRTEWTEPAEWTERVYWTRPAVIPEYAETSAGDDARIAETSRWPDPAPDTPADQDLLTEPDTQAPPDTAAAPHTAPSDAAAPDTAGLVAAGPGTETDRMIVVPGVRLYHRPSCRLIRFLRDADVEEVPREAAEASGRPPCPECQPGTFLADAASPRG